MVMLAESVKALARALSQLGLCVTLPSIDFAGKKLANPVRSYKASIGMCMTDIAHAQNTLTNQTQSARKSIALPSRPVRVRPPVVLGGLSLASSSSCGMTERLFIL